MRVYFKILINISIDPKQADSAQQANSAERPKWLTPAGGSGGVKSALKISSATK
jgi:hypothetical protein